MEGLVGLERASRLITSEKSTHIFKKERDEIE